MGEFGIGQPVPREEDPYLVRGAGRYVDDVAPPGLLRAYMLRSPHAHARIRAIDAGDGGENLARIEGGPAQWVAFRLSGRLAERFSRARAGRPPAR